MCELGHGRTEGGERVGDGECVSWVKRGEGVSISCFIFTNQVGHPHCNTNRKCCFNNTEKCALVM